MDNLPRSEALLEIDLVVRSCFDDSSVELSESSDSESNFPLLRQCKQLTHSLGSAAPWIFEHLHQIEAHSDWSVQRKFLPSGLWVSRCGFHPTEDFVLLGIQASPSVGQEHH